MHRLARHRGIVARSTSVGMAICAERIRSVRKFKTLSTSAVVIGGATTLVLAASATAMAAGWSGADLTAIARAPAAAGNPAGYATDLTGQGPVARVVYRTASGHIEELTVQVGHPWSAADLTAIARAPAAAGNPAGYATDLTGQGPVARVVYRTASSDIEELSVS